MDGFMRRRRGWDGHCLQGREQVLAGTKILTETSFTGSVGCTACACQSRCQGFGRFREVLRNEGAGLTTKPVKDGRRMKRKERKRERGEILKPMSR